MGSAKSEITSKEFFWDTGAIFYTLAVIMFYLHFYVVEIGRASLPDKIIGHTGKLFVLVYGFYFLFAGTVYFIDFMAEELVDEYLKPESSEPDTVYLNVEAE